MTTQIVPSSGEGALLTQQGPGTSPGYSALDIRRMFSGALQEGVYGTSTTVSAGGVSGVAAADFMVTQRAAGANLSVDINMPGGGMAFVQGDTIAGQGLYAVPVAASNINEDVAAADLTNPRIDSVILEVQDNVLDASGGNLARTRVLTGTPTSGATLTNRSGAVALPGSALLLADVLVPANASTIPNSNIRDRRKWARGAFRVVEKTTVVTTSSGTASAVDSSTFQSRVECSGAPIRLTLVGRVDNSVTQQFTRVYLYMDGAAIQDGTTWVSAGGDSSAAGTLVSRSFVPTAGSHVFDVYWSVGGGTATLQGSSTNPVGLTLEERIRQSASNAAVTTG